MIFVLFLIDLLAFGGFIWLLIMYLQSQYGDGKTVKNIIPYMFISLIIFCIGIFGVRIFSSIEYNASSDNISSNNNKTAEVKKATPKKKHVKKFIKKQANPNIVKIKAIDSSNDTYNEGDIISSPNMDNVINFNVITASPVNLNYNIDDNSEANVLSFQKVNDNEYAVSVKMLKNGEGDAGADMNFYYVNNGYHGKTDFQLSNYNFSANDNGKPTTIQIKKFKNWINSDDGIKDEDNAGISDASYDEDNNTINLLVELIFTTSGNKSNIKEYESEIKKKTKDNYIDFKDLTINFNDDNTNDLVASKPKDSSLVFYKAFYTDSKND